MEDHEGDTHDSTHESTYDRFESKSLIKAVDSSGLISPACRDRDFFCFIEDFFEAFEEVTEMAEGGRPDGGMGLEKSMLTVTL